jgi:hypothetical protein
MRRREESHLYHYYSSERIEKKAEEILMKYNDGVLLMKPQAMDVDHFAEFYCKATIDFANLSEDGLTLGLTCFNDGKLLVWDDEHTKEYPIDVKKGFIFIDKSILECEVEGRIKKRHPRCRLWITLILLNSIEVNPRGC